MKKLIIVSILLSGCADMEPSTKNFWQQLAITAVATRGHYGTPPPIPSFNLPDSSSTMRDGLKQYRYMDQHYGAGAVNKNVNDY